MEVDLIEYLKRNLRPDPDIDLTEQVIEYISGLETQLKAVRDALVEVQKHLSESGGLVWLS